jgi:hypothetical protein
LHRCHSYKYIESITTSILYFITYNGSLLIP